MAADLPAELPGPAGALGTPPTPCLLHAAAGEYRPGVQLGALCVECVCLRPPAALPAELREAAGRAAHARNWLGRVEAAQTHVASNCRCGGCARWPGLTDDQRESFRASQDPALSVVWPVLAECASAAARAALSADDADSRACAVLARLAALGVTPRSP